MAKYRILIADDEAGVRFGIRDFLESNGFDIIEAEDLAQTQEQFRSGGPDAAILDYQLPDGNVLEILPKIREIDSSIPIIILTGHATIELAVQSIQLGADNFVTKPVELPTLLIMIKRLLENQRNRRSRLASQTQSNKNYPNPFIGESDQIKQIEARAYKLLKPDSNILIVGETGTGKGVLARWIHANSSRAEETFVDLNCAGLSGDLLQSELFGHEKGAFTSAVAKKLGLFEVAHRGTMFLDEIGDMDISVQAKLLKVLDEKKFRRIGDVRDRNVDVRLISATHQDIKKHVGEGSFRQDLYFRISTLPISLPPLRERPEDIMMIVESLLDSIAADLGKPKLILADDVQNKITSYHWPGNIRELRNVCERAAILCDGNVIGALDLIFEAADFGVNAASKMDSNLTLEELEKMHIESVLAEVVGKVAVAAGRLGIPKSTLYQKLKKYNIDQSKF